MLPPPPSPTLFPYTTLFRSGVSAGVWSVTSFTELRRDGMHADRTRRMGGEATSWVEQCLASTHGPVVAASDYVRSEEHTSELQSRRDLVCRLLLEKKKNKQI